MSKKDLIVLLLITRLKKAIPLVSELFAPVSDTWNRFSLNLNVPIKDSVPKKLYITPYCDGKATGGYYYV